MLSQRNVTLLGANLLFLGLAGALFLAPGWASALYPLLALVFYWMDVRRDEETHVIFLFLGVLGGLVLVSMSQETVVKAALIVETVGVFSIMTALGRQRTDLAYEGQKTQRQIEEYDRNVLELERDLKYYSSFEVAATKQIRMRRDLTEAAKSLGSTLDPQEVQLRLVRELERRFQGSRVRILPGQPSDPMVDWAVESRSSVLVKDVHTDERFAGTSGLDFRAALLAPIVVMKNPYGYLRVEDSRPGVFMIDDLRTAELFATLASLSLENVHFFNSVNDLAMHDSLTQLHTHRAFQSRLQEEVLRAGRSAQPVSLIMCDVDHFKRYNDTYGHQAGDHLLKTIAGILVSVVRPVDFTARYGGEEFCVILPGCAHQQAVEFADALRGRVSQEAFVFQGQRTGVTMSFGVSSFPQDATTPSQLVRAADERLYRAKHGGRNQVVG
ncbi:MAG: GGDEF domain-containing protein [Elusimicrobia bacterium]|nr:GGDEF domain-containing protein [Elusimicrobiota bacterium]